MNICRCLARKWLLLSLQDWIVLVVDFSASSWILFTNPGFALWWVPGYVALSYVYFQRLVHVGTVLELAWILALFLSIFLVLDSGWSWWTVLCWCEPMRFMLSIVAYAVGPMPFWRAGQLIRQSCKTRS